MTPTNRAVSLILISSVVSLNACAHLTLKEKDSGARTAWTPLQSTQESNPSELERLKCTLSKRLFSRSEFRISYYYLPGALKFVFEHPEVAELVKDLKQEYGDQLVPLLLSARKGLAAPRHRGLVLALVSTSGDAQVTVALGDIVRSPASKEELAFAFFGLGQLRTEEAWSIIHDSLKGVNADVVPSAVVHAAVGQFGTKHFDMFLKLGHLTHDGTPDDRLIGRDSAELLFLKIKPEESLGVFKKAASTHDLLERKYLTYAAFMASGPTVLQEATTIFKKTGHPEERLVILKGLKASLDADTASEDYLQSIAKFVHDALPVIARNDERQVLYMIAGRTLTPELEGTLVKNYQSGDKTPSLVWSLTRSQRGQEILAIELERACSTPAGPERLLTTLQAAMRFVRSKPIDAKLNEQLREIQERIQLGIKPRLIASEMLSNAEPADLRASAMSATYGIYARSATIPERLASIRALGTYLPDTATNLLDIVQGSTDLPCRIEALYLLASHPRTRFSKNVIEVLTKQSDVMCQELIDESGQLRIGPVYEYRHAITSSEIEPHAERLILLLSHGMKGNRGKLVPQLPKNLKYPDNLSIPQDWDKFIRNVVAEASRSAQDILHAP